MQHAKTVALFVAIGVLAYVAGSSAMQAGPSIPNFIQRVQVEGIPTPQQMMRVVEGTPFTVPDRKIFVVTGLGSNVAGTANSHLLVDGQQLIVLEPTAEGLPSIRSIPSGFTVVAGQTVSLTSGGSGIAIAVGYLADA